MAILTTKSVGMDAETANPKPVRRFNWVGQPMKEGDSYWGESEPEPQPPPPPSVRPSGSRRTKRTRKAWSAEARAAYSQRMKAWWQAKRASSTEVEAQNQ